MIDYTSNKPADAPVIRRPVVKVTVEHWNWTTGGITGTHDLTNSVISFEFSKSIKSPMGACSIKLTPTVMTPMGIEKHIFDILDTRDVIIIEEFGLVKFQGYIRKVGTNGAIGADGKPQRMVIITATHIGGLFQEASVGFQLIALRIKELNTELGGFMGAAANMAKSLADLMEGGGIKIKDIVTTLIDEWFNLLNALGATGYKTFMSTYFDFDVGLDDFITKVLPSDVTFFYSSMQEMSLWRELQKLTEAPFNEFFFDEGGRSVFTGTKNVDLPATTCLIGRPTPFDGSVRNGVVKNYFSMMPLKTIPLRYLTRYDFSLSCEESYTVYLAVPSFSNYTEFSLFCMGKAAVDIPKMNKYLLRPLTMNIFYATVAQRNKTAQTPKVNSFFTEMANATKTMQAWFQDNDSYLSGNISIMVPQEAKDDIYLGDKVAIEGLPGWFYVEGISHSWTYGGALSSSLSVTRGYDYSAKKKILFDNAIFKGGRFPAGGVGQ